MSPAAGNRIGSRRWQRPRSRKGQACRWIARELREVWDALRPTPVTATRRLRKSASGTCAASGIYGFPSTIPSRCWPAPTVAANRPYCAPAPIRLPGAVPGTSFRATCFPTSAAGSPPYRRMRRNPRRSSSTTCTTENVSLWSGAPVQWSRAAATGLNAPFRTSPRSSGQREAEKNAIPELLVALKGLIDSWRRL